MRKTATFIITIGFFFSFCTLPFLGIDIFIDSVGFLLIWNGLRALERKKPVFGLAIPISFVLIIVSALQLFIFNSTVSLILQVLRFVLLALLYWKLFIGFSKSIDRTKNSFVRFILLLLLVCEFGVLVSLLTTITPLLQISLPSITSSIGNTLQLVPVFIILIYFISFYGKTSE